MAKKGPRLPAAVEQGHGADTATCGDQSQRSGVATKTKPKLPVNTPPYVDWAEIASIDSFPCSDPPAYNTSRC